MKPSVLIEVEPIPGDDEEIYLYRHDQDFFITVGHLELMSSRMYSSEEALGEIGCLKVRDREKPRILIGGLGMGFTLAAALRTLPPESEVIVSELIPAVVRWNRGPLGGLNSNALEDSRVTVQEIDVAKLIRTARSDYDAILLDVDNGPHGLTSRANDWLYEESGLQAAFRALRPGGVLAIWSSRREKPFLNRLRRLGFKVEDRRVRARGRKGPRHSIVLAMRTDRKKALPAPPSQ